MKIEKTGFTTNYTAVEAKDGIEYDAHHEYDIYNEQSGESLTTIKFQKGPVKEVGINGIFNEDLILIVIDRLESFQDSKYGCIQNQRAIEYLYAAANELRIRTEERKSRGVEGTSEV